MLSRELNERLTRVGPGTPGGELLRRYWHPIYPEAKLRDNPVAKVRILCEDLVLFRDRGGKLGLVQERCPHRQTACRSASPSPKVCAAATTAGCSARKANASNSRSNPAAPVSRTRFRSPPIRCRKWAG